MILDKLGEIEDLDLLPKHVFQLVRCGPEEPPAPANRAVPAIRWCVTSSSRARIRGSMLFRVLTHDDGSRTRPRTVANVLAVGPEVVSGLNPSYSVLCWCCLAQIRFLR
jgi:hypothetical protein